MPPMIKAHQRLRVKAHHLSTQIMGCHFVITAVHHSPAKAWEAIRAGETEMRRIEDLISSWKLTSETTAINDSAGIRPISVSLELWELIERSLRISRLTGGAFDISGTLGRYYWQFDRNEHSWLSEEEIISLRRLIDFRNIELNRADRSVFLKREGMKIGFGAIGKGYAAHCACLVMRSRGINSGLINASGDLMAWGSPPGQQHWQIHLPDPVNRLESKLQLEIPYGSVVTSGNYENYTLINGRRYSHIVDPRTGIPVTGVKHATVLCLNPEFADAMATAISVLGVAEGLALVNRLNGIACVLIDDKDEVHYSNKLKLLFSKN